MAVRLYGALAIPYRLNGRPAFDLIMNAWRSSAPQLLPTHADSIEPVRREFDLGDPDEAAKSWGHAIWIGRRSKPKLPTNVVTGVVFHANLSVGIDSANPRVANQLVALMESLATATRPIYGVVHALTAAEIDEARAVRRPDLMTLNRVTLRSTLGVGYSRQLQGGIPTLYWQNMFGPPYIEIFGRERLLAAPAVVIRETEWGIILRVSEDPPTEATWGAFRDRREDLIDYLGRDAFWPIGKRVPDPVDDSGLPPLGS